LEASFIFLPSICRTFVLTTGPEGLVAAAAKVLDPQREIREAQAAFEEMPTAQNQIRLAEAQLELGLSEAAAKNFEACLKGPFLSSLEIRFGAARAFVECQRYREAIVHLEAIQNIDQAFRLEAVSLLLARSYAGEGRDAEARARFESVVARYGTFEARAEYAIWALAIGDTATAARLQAEIDQITKRWSPQARVLHRGYNASPECRARTVRQAFLNPLSSAGSLRCDHVFRENIFHTGLGDVLRRSLGLQVFAKDCESAGETAG